MAADRKVSATALGAIRLQEARWQAVLDTVQDAVISIDTSGRIKLFNRAAERIFGYRAEEVLERNVRFLMPPPYTHEHDGYLAEYQRSGVPKAIGRIRSVHATRANGETFPIELSVSEAQFEDQTVYTAIIRDISERQRSAEALGNVEARNQAIVEAALDGIITIDEQGVIDSFNPAASRMFGYTAEEVIGQNVSILMPEHYGREHNTYIENYLRTGVSKIIGIGRDIIGRRRDGTVFPMHIAVSEIQLANSRLFTALLQDTSEQQRVDARMREMEREAQERQRLADIGAITAQIVHDLGNPLAAISMQAQLIVRRARRDPKQPLESVLKAAELVVERVKHLDALVREFLEFAREQRLKLVAIDLGRLLREVAGIWEIYTQDRSIHLQLELPRTPLSIMADEEKLRRVFDNLLKNALEALAHDGGTITIRAVALDGGNVRVSVIDDGPGLPKNVDVFRLFETTKPSGTGLGLPIARQIITAHGGGIEVASIEPHGAVFHIDLPAGNLSE